MGLRNNMLFLYILSLFFALLKCETSDSCSELQHQNCTSKSFSSFTDDIMNCTTLNFSLQSEQVELNRSLTFSTVHDFTLKGQIGQATKILCSRNAGIHFQSVCILSIAFVEFVNCGTSLTHHPITSSSNAILWFYAVFIENSADVTILQASFTNSNGTGLVVRNTDHVNINHCTFHGNSIEDPDSSLSKQAFGGGGGLHIESSCGPNSRTDAHCEDNKSVYNITMCTFTDNRARIDLTASSHDLSGTDVTGLGNGGGMELWFWNVSHHHITIKDSVFRSNEGRWGGGLQVVWCSQAKNNTLIIEDSRFDSNMALENRGGGGLDLGYIGKNVQGNSMNFTRLNITNNSALLGGGTAIFTRNIYNLKGNFLHFTNSSWIGNSAHYGAAINIAPQRLDMQENDKHFLTFESCNFASNRVVHLRSSNSDYIEQRGKGVLLVTGGLISFAGKIKFVNNNSTCVYAVSAILHFKNNTDVLFLNNSARSGAGISLIGYSLIVVAEHVGLTFCNNTVRSKGAAIYFFSIDKSAYVSTRLCFIQKLNPDQGKENVHFNFLGNQALQNPIYLNGKVKPDSIYGSSLASCSANNSNKLSLVFLSIGNFRECSICKSSVLDNFSSGELESACDQHYTNPQVTTVEQDIGLELDFTGKVTFIPGKEFEIPLTNHNHSLEVFYDIAIENHNTSNITVPTLNSVISKHRVILKARPGDSATITLTELGFRKYRISFTAEALDCPPLFRLNNYKCECYPTEDLRLVKFHKCESFTASIRLGYWIDYQSTENEMEKTSQDKKVSMDRYALLNGYCPNGYCSYNQDGNYRPLPQTLNVSNLSNYICQNRSGILCGLCADNLTVYFHSESLKCGTTNKCHLGPLFYLLSEILPLTVLFLVIIFFDISFTSGSLNGFIFFAQMYDIISEIREGFIPNSLYFSKWSALHRVIYDIFNIDFFKIDELSFCLFRTQGTLNILMMNYVAVGYAFLLVVGTVWLIRFCSKFHCLKTRKSNNYSVIQGLAAFLVMVYSKSTYVSIAVLNVSTIYKGSEYYKQVVYLQGNIGYFSLAYLPYAIPAMLCILTLVLFIPLVLIVYPLCNKVLAFLGLAENRFINKLLLPIFKIKPLLDCFQGTFKDECRFFAGLYFVYRATIFLSRLLTNVFLIFTIIEIQLIAMIALHATLWPYQRRAHNIIDLLIFVDLAIINSLKLLNLILVETGGNNNVAIHWFQLIFIYIPLVGFCAWIAHNLVCRLKNFLKKKSQRVSEDIDAVLADDRRNEGIGDDYNKFLDEDHRSRLASENFIMMQRKKSFFKL